MTLLGHDEAWQAWHAALGSSRLHHGWIFSGIKGLGKASFARAAARELVAEPGIPQPEGEHHPDILILDHLPANEDEERKREEGKPFQTRRNITVDQIRRMQRRLNTRPTLGTPAGGDHRSGRRYGARRFKCAAQEPGGTACRDLLFAGGAPSWQVAGNRAFALPFAAIRAARRC